MSLAPAQEDCARILMFRGANKELKNSTGQNAYQVAVAASYYNLADIIQKFKPEEVGENLSLFTTSVTSYLVILLLILLVCCCLHWNIIPLTLMVVAVCTVSSRTRCRGTDEPFKTRRLCFPSGCVMSVEWLAFLSQSRFFTVNVCQELNNFLFQSSFQWFILASRLQFLALYLARLLHSCWHY